MADDIRPETDTFHAAASAIDDIVMKIADEATLHQTLLRVLRHLRARIRQSKPEPTGDWLDG